MPATRRKTQGSAATAKIQQEEAEAMKEQDADDTSSQGSSTANNGTPATDNAKSDTAEIANDLDKKDWHDMYKLLYAYWENNGHCTVPQKFEENGIKLGAWVSMQRTQKRRPAANMQQYRIDKLERIGFVWNMNSERWESQFVELKLFHAKHGHCQVERSHDGGDTISKLYCWCIRQKLNYRKQQRGKVSPLTPERILKLDILNFRWDEEVLSPDTSATSPGSSATLTNQASPQFAALPPLPTAKPVTPPKRHEPLVQAAAGVGTAGIHFPALSQIATAATQTNARPLFASPHPPSENEYRAQVAAMTRPAYAAYAGPVAAAQGIPHGGHYPLLQYRRATPTPPHPHPPVFTSSVAQAYTTGNQYSAVPYRVTVGHAAIGQQQTFMNTVSTSDPGAHTYVAGPQLAAAAHPIHMPTVAELRRPSINGSIQPRRISVGKEKYPSGMQTQSQISADRSTPTSTRASAARKRTERMRKKRRASMLAAGEKRKLSESGPLVDLMTSDSSGEESHGKKRAIVQKHPLLENTFRAAAPQRGVRTATSPVVSSVSAGYPLVLNRRDCSTLEGSKAALVQSLKDFKALANESSDRLVYDQAFDAGTLLRHLEGGTASSTR